MDTRYRDRRYSVELTEEPYGAFLVLRHRGRAIGDVTIAYLTAGADAPLEVRVREAVPGAFATTMLRSAGRRQSRRETPASPGKTPEGQPLGLSGSPAPTSENG